MLSGRPKDFRPWMVPLPGVDDVPRGGRCSPGIAVLPAMEWCPPTPATPLPALRGAPSAARAPRPILGPSVMTGNRVLAGKPSSSRVCPRSGPRASGSDLCRDTNRGNPLPPSAGARGLCFPPLTWRGSSCTRATPRAGSEAVRGREHRHGRAERWARKDVVRGQSRALVGAPGCRLGRGGRHWLPRGQLAWGKAAIWHGRGDALEYFLGPAGDCGASGTAHGSLGIGARRTG